MPPTPSSWQQPPPPQTQWGGSTTQYSLPGNFAAQHGSPPVNTGYGNYSFGGTTTPGSTYGNFFPHPGNLSGNGHPGGYRSSGNQPPPPRPGQPIPGPGNGGPPPPPGPGQPIPGPSNGGHGSGYGGGGSGPGHGGGGGGYGGQPYTTNVPRPPKPLVKPDVKSYPRLKDIADIDKWIKDVVATARAHGIDEVLSPNYVPNPYDLDECQLFKMKQMFMYAVLRYTVLPAELRQYVETYASNSDAQQTFTDIMLHVRTSTHA
ncbi:MAG: hypothetical protein LC687_03250, partial [Actinobacteria bacterium]|nr:hypothetical protein [Actinomycetota bacterium]